MERLSEGTGNRRLYLDYGLQIDLMPLKKYCAWDPVGCVMQPRALPNNHFELDSSCETCKDMLHLWLVLPPKWTLGISQDRTSLECHLYPSNPWSWPVVLGATKGSPQCWHCHLTRVYCPNTEQHQTILVCCQWTVRTELSDLYTHDPSTQNPS